jgi:hypothetical protein
MAVALFIVPRMRIRENEIWDGKIRKHFEFKDFLAFLRTLLIGAGEI